MKTLLGELLERAQRAYGSLDGLFKNTQRYFERAIERIEEHYDVELHGFSEKIAVLLQQGCEQAENRLEKLIAALLQAGVVIKQRGRVIRVQPRDEEWFVSAHYGGTWIFSLPLHRINTNAIFPDVLKLPSDKLLEVQAGWRAGDEGAEGCRPVITTTQPWQILAWLVTRYGLSRVEIRGIFLNKKEPHLDWRVHAKEWRQLWPGRRGKAAAQNIAWRSLGLLTWLLSDGKVGTSVRLCIGKREVIVDRELVREIVGRAYEIGLGRFLDIIDSRKWTKLKMFARTFSVAANIKGFNFLLYATTKSVFAKTSPENAQKLLSCLEMLTSEIPVRVYRIDKYWEITISGQGLLKLAELYSEWREALRELIHAARIEPQTPMHKKLLELAENLPSPAKSLKEGSALFSGARGLGAMAPP